MKQRYGFLEKLSGGNKKLVLVASFAAIVNGLAAVVGSVLTYLVLYHMIDPLISGRQIDFTMLWILAACFVPTIALYILTETYSYNKAYMSAYRMSAVGRTELADYMKKLPLGYITSRDPGDLSNAIMSDYATLETTNSHALPQLISSVVLPFLVFLGLLFWDWRMSLAMIAVIPVALLLIFGTTKLQYKLSRKQMKSKIDSANRLQEYLTGIKHIKSNGLSGEKFHRLDSAMKDLMKDSIRLEAGLGPIIMIASLLVRSSMIIMTLVGSYLLIGGEIDIMRFIGFLIMGTGVYTPLITAFSNFAELRYASIAGERILDLKNTPAMQGTDTPGSSNHIAFRNVTFRYKDNDVLKNITIDIPEGKVTALVGPSGSGKSTMTRIAARFWDVTDGTVTIGGKDVRTLDPDKHLTKFSEVFQDTYLFEDTIAGNIGFGKDGASMDQIIAAAKASECHDFITKLPSGYDTVVGEGGATLSGGEKQRIAIARALLKDAPIIILDEATSSLDAGNEIAVQNAINTLVKDRTVIVIAHKLKTVRNADNIIVLDAGEVAQQGQHDHLLQQEGLYKKLWTMQTQTMKLI